MSEGREADEIFPTDRRDFVKVASVAELLVCDAPSAYWRLRGARDDVLAAAQIFDTRESPRKHHNPPATILHRSPELGVVRQRGVRLVAADSVLSFHRSGLPAQSATLCRDSVATRQIDGAVLLLAGAPHRACFSQWAYETAARLVAARALCQAVPALRIALSDAPELRDENSPHRRLLSVLGDAGDLLLVPDNGNWDVDDLYLVAPVARLRGREPFVAPEAIDVLAAAGSELARNSRLPTPSPRLVHLVRKDAATQPILNEEEVEIALNRLGFESFLAGELSLAERARILDGCEVLVGAAGGVMMETPFTRRGSEVVLLASGADSHSALTAHAIACAWRENPCSLVVESAAVAPPSTHNDVGSFSILDVDLVVATVVAAMERRGITPGQLPRGRPAYYFPPARSHAFVRQMRRHSAMATLTMPGPRYLDHLRQLHDILAPVTYLEIGVEHGISLALAQHARRAIGIDPSPDLQVELPPCAEVFRCTSDDFFARYAAGAIPGSGVDLAFLDGLHQFEQTLRDLFHVEHFAHRRTIALVHDVLPIAAETAQRTRRTGFWPGEVFKVILYLRAYRPDLRVVTIPTAPSGLAIVTGFSPGSRPHAASPDETERIASATYEEITAGGKAAALNVEGPNTFVAVASRLIGWGVLDRGRQS